jgi:hypothetical protein
MPPAVRRERGRVGALSRSRADDDPELVRARRDLCAARLEDYIRRTVEAAPPLTDAQRARLRDLLSTPARADQ